MGVKTGPTDHENFLLRFFLLVPDFFLFFLFSLRSVRAPGTYGIKLVIFYSDDASFAHQVIFTILETCIELKKKKRKLLRVCDTPSHKKRVSHFFDRRFVTFIGSEESSRMDQKHTKGFPAQ